MNEFAGIAIPDSALCQAATQYAQRVSPAYLFHHVMRSFAFGSLMGQRAGQSFDVELLYLGAVLHDLGLTGEVPIQERFEVEGADAAKAFLVSQGVDELRIDIVWDAIALHTTMSVPQRKRPEIALVQTGAGIDVGVIPVNALSAAALQQVLESWPRLGFKKAMIETLGGLFARNPMAATSPVVSDVAQRAHADFSPFNICDVIYNAAFDE